MANIDIRDLRAAPRVYTIPPGAPFLPTLVASLLDGALVPGFSRAAGPLSLADATIFVPTRRAARALAATFAEQLDAPATFLPRILPLGGLDALEADAMLDDVGAGLDPAVPAAVEPTARRMILTRLILRWSESVRHAIVAIGQDGRRDLEASEALLVATTPADAWHLSGELADLLDEMVVEGVAWQAIKPLGTEAFDRYWGITLDFLSIAIEHWPAILGERGLVDPATRHKHLIDAEIARLDDSNRQRGPIVVAGSTGSNTATARLMAAIARRPTGAIVLPGLDQTLDATAWEAIGPADVGFGSGHGHPQTALHHLLAGLGLTRDAVTALGAIPPHLAARERFVSEALRPAETTDAWQAIATGAAALDRETALASVTVIEAPDEREEALALAVALRETLEGPGSAVLVTPDRTLARRVREDLARWGIEIDDSGGEPLGTTLAGSLARLVLDCVTREMVPVEVLALLAHPAVRLGRTRAGVDRLSRMAELVLFRGVVPEGALFDPPAFVARVRLRQDEEHAPAALRRLRPEDFADLEDLLTTLRDVLVPLFRLGAGVPLGDWLTAHEDAVAALVRTEADASALGGPDGAKLAALFDDLIAAAEPAIVLDRVGYAALFDRIVAETIVRGPSRSHPRLKILGLLEMRLLSADRILLGGLDEGVWPPQARTDAFLSRPMRAALGLSPPERRVGQTAHDFAMAFGQPEVIVSRAAKRGGSPTVPSRFLQRMAAIGGAAWDAARRRGDTYLDLARALDRPDRSITIRRPAPKPPVALRPQKLSVTRVELLRRDPYAIYADRILKLRPLDPIDAAVGPREWGTLFHGVLRGFVETFRDHPLPPGAIDTLLERTQDTFADLLAEPHFRTFMGPRLERWAHGFHGWHALRRPDLATVLVEEKGTLTIPLDDGTTFELTANADRIETSHAGAVQIIDYKTGQAPSKKEVAAGFAPQLTLEAAIALQGGFAALGVAEAVEGALYVKFGTGREPAVTALTWDDRSFGEVVAEHLQGLRDLLNAFRNPATGYVARPFPQFLARHSDYDHLSRVKEWSATGGAGETNE